MEKQLWKLCQLRFNEKKNVRTLQDLRPSFVVSLHSLGHSGGSQFKRKKQTFSADFSQFFNHLICCYACKQECIRTLMHSWCKLVGMYNTSTKF